jgi:signal-transduction protein with cAMP-binding, CBS, and nucleotidyltransferase domain
VSTHTSLVVGEDVDLSPVVHGDRPIGVVRFSDVLRHYDSEFLSIQSADPAQLRRVAEAFTRAADDLDLALVVHSEKASA